VFCTDNEIWPEIAYLDVVVVVVVVEVEEGGEVELEVVLVVDEVTEETGGGALQGSVDSRSLAT
jgi:hypothetical protein